MTDSVKVILKLSALLTLYLVFVGVLYAANSAQVPYSFGIQTTGVTVNPTFWDAGNVTQGESISSPIFLLTNQANAPRTLHMTSDLNSSIGIISWSLEGFILQGKVSVNATFMLSANATAPIGFYSGVIFIMAVP